MDRLTPERRSWNMSRVRSNDTQPELAVRSVLHRMGYRFSLRRKDLPGKPDIVLPKHRLIVFVHGCFWHQHRNCRDGRVPKSRRTYWSAKLMANVKRDARSIKALRLAGWRTLSVWECQTVDTKSLARKLERTLTSVRSCRRQVIRKSRSPRKG